VQTEVTVVVILQYRGQLVLEMLVSW